MRAAQGKTERMKQDVLSVLADANYFEGFRRIATAMDGSEVIESDGLLLIRTGLPAAMFNIAFVTRALQDPRASIERAIGYFDQYDLPFVVRVRAGVDDDAERAAEGCGLPYSDTVPGMTLAPIPAMPVPPSELDIRAAHDRGALDDHVDVLTASFGMPREFGERLINDRVLRLAGCEFYVGYVDDAPVASSMLCATDRTAGVWNVGCSPAQRKRGFGEAMTWHAVRRGAELQCDVANLQASEMGQPIYERMGFRLVSPYRTFTRRAVVAT